MAIDVKTRFKSFLPGAGFDSAGGPKQGKTRIVGIIDVTSYDGEEGEPLKAVDVGLTTIDSLTIRVRDGITSGVPAANIRGVHYVQSTGHFYLTLTASSSGVVSPVATAQTETLEFVAEGDGAQDVELT